MLTSLFRSLARPRSAFPRNGRLLRSCLAACFVCLACGPETVEAQLFKPLTVPAAGPRPIARTQVRLAPSAPSAAAAAAATPFPLANTFKLHSRPQAALKIYLDFDGHVTENTPWNVFGPGTPPKIWTVAYSLDTDSANFSDVELTEIQGMWQRVAEAYSPFHVDVTTEAPLVADLIDTGGSDGKWGVRVLIGVTTPDQFPTAGGVAFLGAFGAQFIPTDDVPCFAFSDKQGNDSFTIYQTIVHESGHTLGLEHDGLLPDLTFASYYGGHGTGATGWSPFMGAGFNQQLQQWSRGEYVLSNNYEDDLSIITTQNGFTYRADDAGNSTATAKAIAGTVVASTVAINQPGVIERRTDTDWFKLVAKTGALSVSAVGAPLSTMLDIKLDLLDANGVLIVSDNPTDELTASLTRNVTAGTYYVRVDGVGKGDLATGYTDYGSLGQYTLTGSYVVGSTPPTASSVIASYNDISKTLTVTGDALANSVSIVRDSLNSDGFNLKVEGGAGTKIKVGLTTYNSYLFKVTGVNTAITLDINMNAGNDILSVDSVQLLNAKFELGPGADNLAIKRSPAAIMIINADTSATNVAGADSVLIQNSNVTTSLTCNLGPFNDTFSLSGSIVKFLNLPMGTGNDSATLAYCTLTDLAVDGGAGTDTLVRTTSTVTNAPAITNVEIPLVP